MAIRQAEQDPNLPRLASNVLEPVWHSVLYNWLIWHVLKLAFFQKDIFPVFNLASVAVRTTPSTCRHRNQ